MKDLSEMNEIVKGIYMNPFTKENWERFASMVSDLKKEKLKINLIIDTSSSLDIGYQEQLNIKEFKQSALNLQAFELVAILRKIEKSINKRTSDSMLEHNTRDEYFFKSKEHSNTLDLIVPNDEFIAFFLKNCVDSRQPNYRIIFNYLR